METPDYESWFRSYADAYTRSLGDTVEVDVIRGFYAATVLALGVDGSVNAANTAEPGFSDMLVQMYGFYKAVGVRRMAVDRVEVTPLYENHDRVQVFFAADMVKPDGAAITLRFDLVYLVQRRAAGPAIFAFIAGDEMALYREHGLVDEHGQPVPRA